MRRVWMDIRAIKRVVIIIVVFTSLTCIDAIAQGRVQWVLTDVNVHLSVRDNNDEPLEGASVYLVEKGDTLITNFTITDKKGQAHIGHVTQGSYFLNIEMLGFLPVRKEYTFRDRTENLGTFKMQVDQELLEAAKITAAGNPIIVKQDTIVFIASAFGTKRNATLKDLIRKFPGCEVSEDGTITVNGERVSRITVGGRTFFSGDNTVALNNLPAQIVEKVSVIDQQSESAGFTGIRGETEKVMDVTLKKEYQTGFFGNAAVDGGSTLRTPIERDPMFEDHGLLYNANALVAAYDSLTQVTVVGNLNNFKETEGGRAMLIKGENKGLTATRQAGVNVNTLALKGFETDLSLNFSNGSAHDFKHSTQTSAYGASDSKLLILSQDKTTSNDTHLSLAGTIRNKNRRKYLITVSPYLAWSSNCSTLDKGSSSFSNQVCLGETQAAQTASRDNIRGRLNLDAGIKNIFGKEGRAVTLTLFASASNGKGSSHEQSVISPDVEKDLLFENSTREARGNATLSYVEPIAPNWAVSISSTGSTHLDKTVKDAFDHDAGKTPNEYYSASSFTRYLDFNNKLLVQYSKGAASLQLGAAMINTYNAAQVKSLGVTSNTGGDWVLHAAPFVNVRTPIGRMSNLELKYAGMSSAPEAYRMQPTINISNPADIRIGNIYLNPVFKHDAGIEFRGNVTGKFIQYLVKWQLSLESNSIVDASWIADNGTRYYIPVNSLKPGKTFNLYLNYGMPLDRDNKLRVYLTPIFGYSRAVSYQNPSSIAISLDNIDYADVIAAVYGNEKGDRFYGGQSGFTESATKTFSLNTILTLQYENDKLSFLAGCQFLSYRTRYTLDTDADFYRSILSPTASINYKLPKGFALWTDFTAKFRRGYSELNDRPEYRWGVELTKDIGAFTLTLRGIDLLNSARNYTVIQTADYIQETYGLMLGRSVLFGVKFNFGKMTAINGSKATQAMLKMTMDK